MRRDRVHRSVGLPVDGGPAERGMRLLFLRRHDEGFLPRDGLSGTGHYLGLRVRRRELAVPEHRKEPNGLRQSVARSVAVASALGLGSQPVACGSIPGQVQVVDPGANDAHQRTEVTVLGPLGLLQALQASRFDHVRTDVSPSGEGVALFRSPVSADWNSTFSLATAGAQIPSRVALRPWLCPRISEAGDTARSGTAVTEQRTIEIDDQGRFWTNGRFGEAFPTVCSWTASNTSGRGESAIQDGPCLCVEDGRRKTLVDVRDAQGNVVFRPESCVARFGATQAAPSGSVVNVALVRDLNGPDGSAFVLALTHCLQVGQAPPFDVTAADFRSLQATCPLEGAAFDVGEVTSGGKPGSLTLVSGVWHVGAASPARDGAHVSDLDLTFTDAAARVYVVKGHVELPQILE